MFTSISPLLCLLLAIHVQCGLDAERDGFQAGILVIPGLGRPDRLTTVIHNLKLLPLTPLKTLNDANSTNKRLWDCVVYVYAPRSDEAFWGRAHDLRYLSTYCEIVENPEKKVTDNLFLVQPALLRRSYEYMFILLDDIKIQTERPLNLTHMIKLMQCNHLTVLSPIIVGANKGGGQKFRTIMQTPAPSSSAGYLSSFVEIFAWVLTMPAYTALWELLCPAVNPYAWGYDFWYNQYARDTVPGHKMGITNHYALLHVQDTSDLGLGRTDNTKVEVKWNAVLAQERHYKQYKNIPLHKYRKTFDIANTSWNGAVKGLMKDCG